MSHEHHDWKLGSDPPLIRPHSHLSENEPTQKILGKVGIILPLKDIRTAKEEREWKRTIQFALHREIPARTEAKFYTPFFIRSTDAHRDFWLIHLSGHFRARDVMVGLHWQESTTFAHYGRSGLRMLGYDSPAIGAVHEESSHRADSACHRVAAGLQIWRRGLSVTRGRTTRLG